MSTHPKRAIPGAERAAIWPSPQTVTGVGFYNDTNPQILHISNVEIHRPECNIFKNYNPIASVFGKYRERCFETTLVNVGGY